MQTFTFKPINQIVRVETIAGEPWFVAKDICEALSIEKHLNAVSRLDDDERGPVVVDTLGGKQTMTAVNESGLYNLIFQSRKPEAKAFRKWVTGEVLPSIRKTGRYDLPTPKQTSIPPRARSRELGSFYNELRKWVRKSDVREVADERGISEKSVMCVVRGNKMGMDTLKLLTPLADENRRKGRRSDIKRMSNYYLELSQLSLDFMEGGER